ncbi:MAG: nitroreductase family protein [Rikenellaceae bacterium]
MEYLKLVDFRRSFRKFQPKMVENHLLDQIFRATFTAPSSKSSRSSRFIVVTNPDILEQLSQMRSRGASFIKGAPMAIVVCGDNSLTDLWVDNCAISTTLMQLAIHDLGLGSCWVHVHSRLHVDGDENKGSVEDYLKGIIDIPQNWSVACVVALGYPTDTPIAKKQYDDTDKILYVK